MHPCKNNKRQQTFYFCWVSNVSTNFSFLWIYMVSENVSWSAIISIPKCKSAMFMHCATIQKWLLNKNTIIVWQSLIKSQEKQKHLPCIYPFFYYSCSGKQVITIYKKIKQVDKILSANSITALEYYGMQTWDFGQGSYHWVIVLLDIYFLFQDYGPI